VQQTVVAAGGSGGNVVAFEQNSAQAAQGAITGDTGTRCAAANNDHIVVV
jgi:hypothetical protein